MYTFTTDYNYMVNFYTKNLFCFRFCVFVFVFLFLRFSFRFCVFVFVVVVVVLVVAFHNRSDSGKTPTRRFAKK